ncbi:MAG TPA: hypothetical protein VGJ02_10040 [Pyrinomonadaceae bacterium]
MSSIRCKYCDLTNFADAFECKRCGKPFAGRVVKGQRSPRRFSYVSLLIFAAVALLVYYMMGGFEQKMAQVNANEADRIATQKKDPDAGLSRSEYDQKRSGQYGTAVQSSNSLQENQKHNDDVQKAMSAAQGK